MFIHGLSCRHDGSRHHEWDLLWARSPIREQHIRWQIWHSKLLASGGPDLHRSRLDSQLLNASYFELFYCWLARGTRVLTIQKVQYHSGSMWTWDSPWIIGTLHQDARNHDGVDELYMTQTVTNIVFKEISTVTDVERVLFKEHSDDGVFVTWERVDDEVLTALRCVHTTVHVFAANNECPVNILHIIIII